MNKNKLLVLSIAAILSLSVIAVSNIPIAVADNDDDKNDDKKPKFNKNPDFEAELEPRTGGPYEEFNGKAKFWLSKDGESLKYRIKINGMDLNPGFASTSNIDDDVTKTHLHQGSIFGQHLLNIYKAPGQQDDDLTIKPNKGVLRGVWEDSDSNDPNEIVFGSTKPLTTHTDDLCHNDVWLVLHGTLFDDTAVEGKDLQDRAIWGKLLKTDSNKICKKLSD